MGESVGKDERARIHVSNFNGAINVNFNKIAALEIFDLINANFESISPTLRGLSEKIEKQFHHMGELSR